MLVKDCALKRRTAQISHLSRLGQCAMTLCLPLFTGAQRAYLCLAQAGFTDLAGLRQLNLDFTDHAYACEPARWAKRSYCVLRCLLQVPGTETLMSAGVYKHAYVWQVLHGWTYDRAVHLLRRLRCLLLRRRA